MNTVRIAFYLAPLFILNLKVKSLSFKSKIKYIYPLSLNYILLINDKGIFTLEYTTSFIFNIINDHYFPQEININNKLIKITKYSKIEGGYILCLINNILFILSEKGKFLFSYKFETIIINYNSFQEIFKKANNDFYFIVGFYDNSLINISLCKFNILKKEVYINKTIIDKNFVGDIINCIHMYSNINGNVLACFYENKIYSNLSVTVFDIKNDIKNISFTSCKIPLINNNYKYLISSDKKRIIIYNIVKNQKLFLYYDIDINKFSSNYYNNNNKININALYFEVIKKYIGSSSPIKKIINVIILNQNVKSLIINNEDIIRFDNNFFYMKYILILYSILFKRYLLISIEKINEKKLNIINNILPTKYNYLMLYGNLNKNNFYNPIKLNFINCFYKKVKKINIINKNSKINNFSFSKSIFRSIRYNKKRHLNELERKCNKIDYINNLCLECNKEEGYYPIYHDYNYDNRKTLLQKYIKKYFDCYNENTVPTGYYLNNNLNAYEKCYFSCKRCYGKGSRIYNNCSSCIDNYIFQPEIPFSTNCVPKCEFYYYYSFYGDYKCTDGYFCPDNINLLVEKENKCLSDCKYDLSYKYQYNGECIITCPNNTYPNSQNICLDSNIQKYTISIKNSNLKLIFLKDNFVDEFSKTFSKEFSYTNNHIMQFKFENISIIFLKNITFLEDNQLSFSQIYFNESYNNIINYYKFSSPPILSIIDIIDNTGNTSNPVTKYMFYDPNNGLKLNTTIFNDTLTIKKNISYILENQKYQWLLKQEIDFLNLSSPFYTNLCFHFNSFNGKDIILRDRIINYFPNISLCEESCELKIINYEKKIIVCECNFTYFSTYINFGYSELVYYDELIKNITQIIFILENKFSLLFCYNNLFNYKFILKNDGEIILFIIIIIQIICTIIFTINGFDRINKYLFYVLENYIKLTKKKININSSRKESSSKNDSNNSEISLTSRTFPIVNSLKIIQNDKFNIIKNNFINSSFSSIQKSRNESYINNSSLIQQESENIENTENILANELKSLKIKNKNKINAEVSNNSNILIERNEYLEKDIKKYVSTSPNEMEFYEIVKYDKRKFCQFFWDKIKRNQIFIKTFIFKEETIPRELKIIVLIIYIDLCLFPQHYISQLRT